MASATGIKPFKWDDKYDFPRDFKGYGPKSFDPQWPNGAKIAVSFVINYEEGGERSVLNGDVTAEVGKGVHYYAAAVVSTSSFC